MDAYEIYIGNSKLDLNESTQVVFTFQANDVFKPETIQADYSNEFEVPATQNNEQVLGFSSLVNSQTTNPYQALECRVYRNGIEIIPYGKAIINAWTDRTYKLQIFTGNKSLFDVIGDKSVRLLSFSQYEHIYNSTNVIASRTNTAGYVYDMINRGKVGQESAIAWNDLLPSIFAKSVFDQIFKEAGFSYVWKKMPDLFTKLLIAKGSKFKYDDDIVKARSSRAASYPPNRIDGSNAHGAEDGDLTFNTDYAINYDYRDCSDGVSNNYKADTYQYVADVQMKVKVSVTMQCDFRGVTKFDIILYKKSNGIDSEIYHLEQDTSGSRSQFNFQSITVVLNTPAFLLLPGESIHARYRIGRRGNDYGSWEGRIYLDQRSFITIDMQPDFPEYATVQLQQWLSDYTQKDFVKFVIQFFGCLCQTDPYTKTVHITQLSEILENIPVALNWSDKLHVLSGKDEIAYRFGDFGQKNYFMYTESEDTNPLPTGQIVVSSGIPVQSKTFARGTLPVADTTLEVAKELITFPFSGTKTLSGAPYIRNYVLRVGSVPANFPAEYDEKEYPDKLLVYQLVQSGYQYLNNDQILNSDGSIAQYATQITLSDYNRAVSRFLPDLDLQNIVDTYYSTYKAMLDKARFVKAYMRVTETDIANLDHSIPVYLDWYKAYFYINKISQWESRNQLVEVELIRL